MANPPWGTSRDDPSRRSYNPYGFNADKQVPQSLPAIANIAYRGSSRVQDLESRIKVSEQSNRLLLEELMKLQQDLKLALRQNEEMVLKERQERIAIRDKVEAAENMYNRVSMQLLRTEEKVNMEHTTLATLLNQSKEVERALAGGQQRSMMKGEQIDRYISRFRDELSELRQANEQIQSSLRLVGEDVKNIQHRFEMQNAEFDSVNQEIKQKVKRIETESMATMENMQRNKSTRDSIEGSTSQLKQNIESRLSEIRETLNEVRRKTDKEASERRAADQQAELNVEKVQVALRELETKYQEISHAASLNMREKDNVYEVEKSKLSYKMAELTEDTNKKALQREMQLREESQKKFSVLEKRFHEEQTSRLTFEKSVRQEMEKILESLKMHLAEELQNMKQNAKSVRGSFDHEATRIPLSPQYSPRVSPRTISSTGLSPREGSTRAGSPHVLPRGATRDSPQEEAVQIIPVNRTELSKVHEDQSLVKMHECINLLEDEIEAGKKAFEEVLHAEIIARQTQNEQTLEKCNELQEKLSVAVATLQQAISGVTSHTQDAVEQVKNEIYAVLDDNNNSGVRGLAEIDSRLTNLNKHVAELEDVIQSRPPPPATPPPNITQEVPVSNGEDYERLNRKVDRAYKWQEGAEKTLRDLSIKLQPIHGEISKLKAAIEDLENEMEASRLARLASLGGEQTPVKPETPAKPETPVTTAEPAPVPASDPNLEKKVKKAEDDIVQMSTQMEKLENTVNTLRTVLSQKISSEAKTRSSHISELKEQLKQIQKTIDEESENNDNEADNDDEDSKKNDENSKKDDDDSKKDDEDKENSGKDSEKNSGNEGQDSNKESGGES